MPLCDGIPSKSEVLSLDRILIEEVGQFGRYQLRAVALCAVVAGLAGFLGNLYIFTFAKVNTRCLIPECETSSSGQLDFSPPWILDAVPASGDSFDQCRRYRGTLGNTAAACPADLFDRGSVVKCEEYVYEDKNSAIYEFNLACDEWRPFLIGSVINIAMMLSLPCTGFVADRWGRRFTLAFTAFTLAAIGLAKAWASSYNIYVVITFIQFFLGACSFSCAYILAVEQVGPHYKVRAGVTMSSSLAIGYILQTFTAMAVPYWKHLILIVHVPGLFTIAFLWIGPDSIRWLISKGRYEEAKDILVKAAKMNGKTLSEATLKGFCDVKDTTKVDKEEESGPSIIRPVFKHKQILFRCLYTPFWWITTLFVYYGMSLSSVGIIGNKYYNYSAVIAVEIPGYWTAMFLMNRIRRKPLITAGFWICGACQIAYIFIAKENYWWSLSFYLIGKFCISAVMTSIYVYTAELLPTRWRTSLMAYSSMIGRLGSIIAPLTPALSSVVWKPLPFVLFAALALVAGLLVQLAPETRGTPLPDTMEAAAALPRPPSRARQLLNTVLFTRSYNL